MIEIRVVRLIGSHSDFVRGYVISHSRKDKPISLMFQRDDICAYTASSLSLTQELSRCGILTSLWLSSLRHGSLTASKVAAPHPLALYKMLPRISVPLPSVTLLAATSI